MKQKKQIKIIISLLVMIAVLLGGWGLLRTNGLKAEEKKEEKNTTSMMSSSIPLPIADDDEHWLTSYKPGLGINDGGWLDSTQSYISKEYSFAMMFLPGKTNVGNEEGVDFSDGWRIPRDENGDLKSGLAYFETGEEKLSWIKVANVGYLNGRFVDVKVSIKTQESGRDDDYPAWLTLNDSDEFMTIRIDHYTRAMDISYEFFYQDGTPVNNMALYWDMYNDGISEFFFDASLIKNIYSVSREFKVGELLLPNYLLFDVLPTGEFELTASNDIPNHETYYYDRIRNRATFTFRNNSNKFNFKFVSTIPVAPHRGSQLFSYMLNTFTKIQIPDPMSQTHVYPEIIGAGQGLLKEESKNVVSDFTFGFLQQLPWETKNDELQINNRTQKPSWELNPKGMSDVIGFDDWAVIPLDLPAGTVYTDLFDTIAMDDFGKGVLSLKESVLNSDTPYNHYYAFNRSFSIKDSSRIKKVSLEQKPELGSGYYLDFSGDVVLKVTDSHATAEQQGMYPEDGVKTTYDTAINFYAPLEYKYVNSVTGAEIPASSRPTTATATGDGIVTWDAPLTPQSLTDATYTEATGKGSAPVIPGYTFKEAKLNDGDDFQVKVTKLLKDGGDAKKAEDYTQNNVVTLEYQPLYTVDVQVGALDTDRNFGMIPFAPPSGTSAPYVTVQETTAPTTSENAISPTGTEPAAEFTFPTTYDFEVGTGKSYKVTQMKNVNNDYTKPNQATSPVFLINDQNQLVVDGNVVNDLPYKDGDFILSWDATNKKLTIQIINQPNGEYQLVSVEPLEYGKVSLPQKNPDELIKRQNSDWKVQFTDTRLDAYRTPLKLSVRLDQNFTNTNDPTKTISGILLYRPEETTPITPDDFLIEGEEIPIKEKINPDSGTNDIDWPEQAGFLLQIDDEKQTKIFAGDYQAELTFILSEDPLIGGSNRK